MGEHEEGEEEEEEEKEDEEREEREEEEHDGSESVREGLRGDKCEDGVAVDVGDSGGGSIRSARW